MKKDFFAFTWQNTTSAPVWYEKKKLLKSGSKRHFPFPIWSGKRKSGRGLPVSYLSFVLIAEKEKIVFNFGYQSSLCIASVKRKEVFFFQLFFDKWIQQSDTLDSQRAVTGWYAMTFFRQSERYPASVHKREFVTSLSHDLCCLIMILPYSHSLNARNVARNGYGYMRTMQRCKSCGRWQSPSDCFNSPKRKEVMCYW